MPHVPHRSVIPGGEAAEAKRAQQLATHTPNVLIADQDTQMPHRKDTQAITFFVDVSGELLFSKRRDGTGQDWMGRDGTGRDGMRWDDRGRIGTGCNGTGWNRIERNETGRDKTRWREDI